MVLTGLAMFSLYYQISRGLGRIKRIAVTYVGGALLQLGVFLALVASTDLSPAGALIIFGVSSAIPIVACELAAPVVRGRGASFNREAARDLWRIGGPLLIAQAGFTIWFSADQIWVDSTLGSAQVGLYGSAKTLIMIFLVLVAGSNGVVLPRVAELRAAGLDQRARRFILVMMVRLTALAVLMAAVVIAVRLPLLRVVFGDSYDGASGALVALGVSMALYGAFSGITSSAIGWGRPGVLALGVSVASMSEIGLLVLAGGGEIAFAGWANAISIGLGLVAVALALLRRPLR